MRAILGAGDNAASVSDIVTIALALAALVVAVASLYVTSFRRPEVIVDHIKSADDLTVTRWTNPNQRMPEKTLPTELMLSLEIAMANVGSTGTVVEALELVNFREDNADTPLCGRCLHSQATEPPFPLVLERDGLKSCRINAFVDRADYEEDALVVRMRVYRLRSVTVDVSWSFRRQRFVWPSRRETKRRSIPVTIPGTTLVPHVEAHWTAIGIPELLLPADRDDSATGAGEAERATADDD